MANDISPSSNPDNPPGRLPGQVPPGDASAALPPPRPPRKRKRWWLRIIGAFLLLVILLVLLAPTIAGLGFVKSIVVGQVNQNINGSVEIGSYSVGWTGGISANDVKVYDDNKNLVLQLNKFSTRLSLLDAARGSLALGDTVVDIDLVRAEIGDDGQLNYLKLLKQSAKTKSTGERHESSGNAAATRLPAVSGNVTVNYKGTLYQNGSALVQIQPSTAVIKIPDINSPIANDVTLNYSVNNGPVGTINIAGDASAVKNSQLDLADAAAHEQFKLSDVNLKALAPILELLSPALKLQTEGIASGSLSIQAAGTDSLAAGGEIDVAKFAVSGASLKGTDRLAIDQISVPIDISRTVKDGQPFIDVKHADVLLTGGAGNGQLGKITVLASAPQDALISAASLVPAVMQRALLGTEPAAESLIVNGSGTATITADFDVAALASQLPSTVGLQQGTQLTQGHLSHQTTITISKDTAKIDTDTKLPDLQGTSSGKAVQLSPIDISAGLSAVGGASPDLRDLSVHLSSGFLNASGGGATLSQEKLTGSFDLANLQSQAAQFVDLDALLNPPSAAKTGSSTQALSPHVQLAGAGTFDLSTDGDLIKPDGQGKVATSLTITGLDASGIGALPPVKLANLNATLSGDLHRGATAVDYQNFAAAFTAAGITVVNKDPSAPPVLDNETITATIDGDASLPTTQGPQTINLSTLEVKSASGLFGLLSFSKTDDALTLSRENGVVKAAGAISVSADLKKLDDLAQRFSPSPATSANASSPSAQLQSGQLNGKLTLARADQPRTDVTFDGAITNLTVTTLQQPISNETITLALHAVAPDDLTALKADASLDSRFMSVKLANAILELGATAAAKPAGPWDMLQHAEIDLNIPDLPAVYSLINAFSPPAAAQASAILQQGEIAPDDVRFRIISTALHQSDEQPPAETPLEAARRRKREKAARAARAAAQPKPEAPAAPLPPLDLTSGSMVGTINVSRDVPSQTTTLNVTDLALSKLGLARGNSKYNFARDIDLKLAIAVKASDDSSKPSPIAQIQQIQIAQLDGDLGVAKLTMPQPITLSNPGDTSQIGAHGTLEVDGSLGDATPLLAVLEGADKPMPYAGTYDLSQAIGSGNATQGKLLKLVGAIDITNFQVLDDNNNPVYTEPTVAIKNDLDYILPTMPPTSAATTAPTRPVRSNDQAIVRSLTVDMPASQGLAIKFSGRVADPFNKRVIRGLGQEPAARLDLSYDLAKLWPIIRPTLTPEMQAKYKDLKVIGKEERVFNVSGYFPMARTTAESMRHLNADGGLALDELDLPQGLTVTKLDLPFKMTAGVVQTAPSATPQTIGADTTQPVVANTAIANQGAVDLSDITLDMGQPSPVLTIAPDHKLLQSVRINPVLAGTLGEGNLLFKDATQANGLIDVTVVECDHVPLGDLLTHANDAQASITYSISDLAIDGPVPQVLSSVLPLGGQGIHGGIQDGKLALANGEVNNNFALNIIRYVKPATNGQPDSGGTASDGTASATPTDTQGDQLVPVNLPMKFSGGVILASGALKNFLVNIPQGLLPAKFASIFPNGLAVPFTGNASHPKLDLAKAAIQNGGAGFLGGGNNGDGGLGGLLNGLGKKHKKKSSDDSGDSGQ